MPVHPPSAPMTNPPDARHTFRLQGKTISIETHGQATVVMLTFDHIGASGTASHSSVAEPGAASPIVMPDDYWWSLRRCAPSMGPLLR